MKTLESNLIPVMIASGLIGGGLATTAMLAKDAHQEDKTICATERAIAETAVSDLGISICINQAFHNALPEITASSGNEVQTVLGQLNQQILACSEAEQD